MDIAIPKTMKAWQRQLGNPTPLAIQCPVPQPAPDAVLLKVLAAGVCHSDCTVLNLKENLPGWQETFILGHEACGEIVALGADVNSSTLKLGDKVVVMLCAGCRQAECGECSRGLSNICQRGETYGLGFNGVFAEYVAIKHWAAVPFPPEVSPFTAAVASDAVLTAYHAVKARANIKPEHTILILGLGGVGSNAVQIALHLGVKRLLVVDKRQEAVDEAVRLGVPKEDAICLTTGSMEEKVATEGILVDTVVDFVGSQDSLQCAMQVIRPGGRLVQVGLLGEALTFPNVPTIMRELDITSSYNGTVEELRECLELMGKGVIKPNVTTTPMDCVPQVLEDLDSGKIAGRMVLQP